MAATLEVVGTAVALKRGHYPEPDGKILIRQPGDRFPVFKGKTKASWFEVEKAKKGDKPDGAEPDAIA